MSTALRPIDSIWRTRGELALDGPTSPGQAIERLSALFDPEEAVVDRDAGTIAYRKPNPAAQDRLATFSNGRLELVGGPRGQALRYDVGSPALLLTFLAPLLFVALGQGIVALGAWEEAKSAARGEDAGDKEKDKDKDKPKELHWIDKALGAPAPEKPETDPERKKAKEKEAAAEDYAPDRSYGLAALFAALYLFGRWFEPRRLRAMIGKVLAGDPA